jgi:hypothetical protein
MTYEGWANYQTWNVSLWINNDESLYQEAVRYCSRIREASRVHDLPFDDDGMYVDFMGNYLPSHWGDVTPDGVSWSDPTLDHDALDEMLAELAS